MADVATLGLRVDASGMVQAEQAINRVESAGARAENRAHSLNRAFSSAGVAIAAAWTQHKIIRETTAAQDAMAQLEARIQSTGGVAGKTVEELDRMAMALQRTTIYGDEATKGAQALLLSFKQIRGDTFDQATIAVLDLATAMGSDLRSAALQVGKALEDPATQMTYLRRSGISFTKEQIELARHMQEVGDLAGAQALVLKELQVQFGGSAEAARNTLGGALAYLGNQWGDLFEVSAESSAGIIGVINDIGDALPTLGGAFNEVTKEIQLWGAQLAVSYAQGDLFHAKMKFWDKRGIEEAEIALEAQLVALNDLFVTMDGGAATAKKLNTELSELSSTLGVDAEKPAAWAVQAIQDMLRAMHDQALVPVQELLRQTRIMVQQRGYSTGASDPNQYGGPSMAFLRSYPQGLGTGTVSANSEITDSRDRWADLKAELLDSLPAIESTASGIMLMADAFGGLSEETRRALEGVISISRGLDAWKGAQGMTGLAGTLGQVGGAIGVVGGIVGLVSAAFGGDSDHEKETREMDRIDRERESTERFYAAVERFAEAVGGTPSSLGAGLADVLEQLEKLGVRTAKPREPDPVDKEQERLRLIDLYEQKLAEITERFREDLQVRLLYAQGLDEEARALLQMREYMDAVADGWDAETLAMLATVQAAERAKIAEEALTRAREEAAAAAERLRVSQEDLIVRGLLATGQGGAADIARLTYSHRRERIDADPALIPLLDFVQGLEMDSLRRQQALDQQMDAIQQAAAAQQAALDKQIDIASDQLAVAQEQLREQERTVETMRRVVESLTEFGASLSIGPQSVLSPVAQLAETRRQMETMTALALGGDVTAAESLPGAVRAMLDASRSVNASGLNYVADYDRAVAVVEAVRRRFVGQLSTEEMILRELQAQTASLQDQIAELQAAKEAAAAAAAAQIAQLQAAQAQANADAAAQLEAILLQLGLLGSWSDKQDDAIADAKMRYAEDASRGLIETDLMTETNDYLEASLNVQQVGFSEVVNRLVSVEEAIRDTARETNRTLEGAF